MITYNHRSANYGKPTSETSQSVLSHDQYIAIPVFFYVSKIPNMSTKMKLLQVQNQHVFYGLIDYILIDLQNLG